MAETLTVELHNRQQAWAAIKAQVFPFLTQVLQGGHRWVLTITRRKRTSKQNRRYWGNGVLKQIAEQAAPNGKLYPAEIWHEQFCEFSDKVEAYAATELGVTFYDLQGH